MKKHPSTPPKARSLRERAEAKLHKQKGLAARPLTETNARALVHELQVHQIELKEEVNALCARFGQPPRYVRHSGPEQPVTGVEKE
jgi:hypothetical protein